MAQQPRIVLLLRGINVGGHNMIKMDVLRRELEGIGCLGVQTFLQTGNILLDAGALVPSGDLSETAIREHIQVKFHTKGPPIETFYRTQQQWIAIVDANPFPKEAAREPSKFFVAFLQSPVPAADVAALQQAFPDKRDGLFSVQGTEVYLYLPQGLWRSKLKSTSLERILNQYNTCRNWNTVTRIASLLSTNPDDKDEEDSSPSASDDRDLSAQDVDASPDIEDPSSKTTDPVRRGRSASRRKTSASGSGSAGSPADAKPTRSTRSTKRKTTPAVASPDDPPPRPKRTRAR
ncbi:uncharacterized protein BJ171DRAFT_503218 [Polychytrium aggregatum]|uniref:uncharacterized protein n=1 Tax=Polychytrium aggregatum TaxID=110093 RepID=UPI0022FF1DAF|nr:uncharacterized protein BJ171DRAFT_503218 [Polychytrium aggregatum]KAI9205194.1 hypothetical protein BJ171DRAFT_503218 [Polychytrium aggregatum]